MAREAVALNAAQEYWIDAWQRAVLCLDALNQRGNTHLAEAAKEAPHVLSFAAEVVLDGRTLERPVNYALVRIAPPAGVTIDPAKPPIVVVDPRAGHGPGIGGMKPESEIGVALRAGHAVYFIGFLPKPVKGQTIEDVSRAEAIFIETVAARHREAEGKPIVIANCQAGWHATFPNKLGPRVTLTDFAACGGFEGHDRVLSVTSSSSPSRKANLVRGIACNRREFCRSQPRAGHHRRGIGGGRS